jgi:hypothetical protein
MLRAFPHKEPRYYFLGRRAGSTNLTANGSRLGVKKTLGKLSQPFNAASRFPEYCCVDTAIRKFLATRRDPAAARILDVGSPKLSERRAAPFIARVMDTATSFWPA